MGFVSGQTLNLLIAGNRPALGRASIQMNMRHSHAELIESVGRGVEIRTPGLLRLKYTLECQVVGSSLFFAHLLSRFMGVFGG